LYKIHIMSEEKSIRKGCCPVCGTVSISVKGYGSRKLSHYRVGGMETLIYPSTSFRCVCSECPRKTFTQIDDVADRLEVIGRSRYTKSSKAFVANKMLKKQISYHSLCAEIKEDFGGKTAYSSLPRWTAEMQVVDVPIGQTPILVVHTDEKHPSKKKEIR
jgi:hypothetical protein